MNTFMAATRSGSDGDGGGGIKSFVLAKVTPRPGLRVGVTVSLKCVCLRGVCVCVCRTLVVVPGSVCGSEATWLRPRQEVVFATH